MDDLFSTVSKHFKQQAVVESLTDVNEILTEIHQCLLAFCGEDTMDVHTVHC